MTSKLVILDRDGVINDDPNGYIKHPDEWQALPGSLEAISLFTQHGFSVAIATNQSGIGRGFYDEAALIKIHEKMLTQCTALGGQIDKIAYCPHHPEDNCGCRKPNTGLLKEIAAHFDCDLTGVPLIGDSRKDIEAALAMGCQPFLVLTGFGQTTLSGLKQDHPARVFDNLLAAATVIIQEASHD